MSSNFQIAVRDASSWPACGARTCHRSMSFTAAIKGGVGWLEVGIRFWYAWAVVANHQKHRPVSLQGYRQLHRPGAASVVAQRVAQQIAHHQTHAYRVPMQPGQTGGQHNIHRSAGGKRSWVAQCLLLRHHIVHHCDQVYRLAFERGMGLGACYDTSLKKCIFK